MTISVNIFAVIAALFIAVPAATAAVRLYIRRSVEQQTARYQNDLTKRHCEEVETLYRQTRGWRHDIRGHLQAMQAYLDMGENTQLQRYIRELTEDYSTIDIVLKTGNVMLDAILNSKLSVLRAKDIRVDATASVPGGLAISDVDLCVMVGNLLDNAMEACLKVPAEERFIRLYIARVKESLYVYVMNSASGDYRKGKGGYLSTKASDGHGYGLQRIDEVVRKYKGYQNRQDEGNVFAAEILLPL